MLIIIIIILFVLFCLFVLILNLIFRKINKFEEEEEELKKFNVMNKQQAYIAMCQGHKVCNQYYGSEEYAFINQDGLIEYEDGCVVGDQFSENWVKYQDPECKFEWSICDDRGVNPKSDPYLDKLGDGTEIFPIHNYRSEMTMHYPFYEKKEFIPKNHKRTNKKGRRK